MSDFNILARIMNKDANDGTFATLRFPSTKEEVQEALKVVGIDSKHNDNITFTDYRATNSNLHFVLPKDADINELNYLSIRIGELDDNEFQIFEEAIGAERHCGTISEIINLTFADNIKQFEFQPVLSEEMYGEFIIQYNQDENAHAFNRLKESPDPTDHALAAYIELLEAHVDKESLGNHTITEEKGFFTDYGYLVEGENFKEFYHGTQDIPPEYCVFAYPDFKPNIKVENTDLSTLVYKIHALAGENMSDAQYNVNTLANGSEHYLLLMNDKITFLCDMKTSYQHDTMANEVWMMQEVTPNSKAFSLQVTGCEGDSIIGNLVEIDHEEQREDIRNNSLDLTYVDAKLKDGSNRSYTSDEWDTMEAIDRDKIQSCIKHYDTDSLVSLEAHIEKISAERDSNKTVSVDEMLTDLNRSYMIRAKNPQPDMLRINLDAAKDILVQGNVPVYRLLNDDFKSLNTLDVVKNGLCFQFYREFAIKCEDMSGFNKWAERSASDIVRNAIHRTEHEKSHKPQKSQDHER